MTDAAFLAAIRDEPDGDLPRLAYADWLDERGRADRAEFIRVQVELGRGVRDRGRSAGLLHRARELLGRHRAEWLGPLLSLTPSATFERGFVGAAAMAAANFVAHGGAVLAAHPVARLRLDHAAEYAEELADCPYLEAIAELDLDGNRLGDAGVRALAESPRLGRLRALGLGLVGVSADGVHAILSSANLPQLADLRLAQNVLAEAAAEAIAAAKLPRLTRLDLGINHFGPSAAHHLAESAGLGGLTALRLAANWLTTADVRRLAQSPGLRGVRILDVSLNAVPPGDAAELRREFGPRLVC